MIGPHHKYKQVWRNIVWKKKEQIHKETKPNLKVLQKVGSTCCRTRNWTRPCISTYPIWKEKQWMTEDVKQIRLGRPWWVDTRLVRQEQYKRKMRWIRLHQTNQNTLKSLNELLDTFTIISYILCALSSTNAISSDFTRNTKNTSTLTTY